MSVKWVAENADNFKRDVLRDFCFGALELEQQFARFDLSGSISFPIISGLLGEGSNKGPLWQLKDTAHHLFQREPRKSSAGNYLDWSIGFLFHECVKIREASYQAQNYAPQLTFFAGAGKKVSGMGKQLLKITGRGNAAMRQYVDTARELVRSACKLFCEYLKNESGSRPLARLIYDREELLRQVFRELYPTLLISVYGNAPELCPLEAAKSLEESGHAANAREALAKALSINPHSKIVLELSNALQAKKTGRSAKEIADAANL